VLDSRLIDRDPVTGVETWFHFDEADESFTLEDRQSDVTPILESNKTDLVAARSDWKGDMHRVACIPLTLLHDLKKKGILDDAKAFKRWLADPENRHFRTKGGAL
jgi:hypothetical protein